MRVIFFLAHSGVTQPEVWERWIEGYRSKIIYRIFCNEEYVNNEFMKGRVLPFHMKTGWGELNLVKVLQKGYKKIIKEVEDVFDEDVDLISLVSGFDVPIMSAKKYLELPNYSYIVDNGEVEYFFTGRKPLPLYQSTQWMHLTSSHAELIAHADVTAIAEQLDKYNEKMHKYNIKHNLPPMQKQVYDEIIPMTILKRAGLKIFARDKVPLPSDSSVSSTEFYMDVAVDEPLSDFERKHQNDPSPIQWEDLDSLRTVDRGNDNIVEQEEKSLTDVLTESHEQEFVFFRKIKKDVQILDFLIYLWKK